MGIFTVEIMGLTPSGDAALSWTAVMWCATGSSMALGPAQSMLEKKAILSAATVTVRFFCLCTGVRRWDAMLDAEVACVLYDGETRSFIAARDPINIRPLYYGYDRKGVIVFASGFKTWR